MATVTMQQCKDARHPGCKWTDAQMAASWGPDRPQELVDVIARYIAAPRAEHRDRAYMLRQLLSSEQRRKIGMLHGPDPAGYMRKALAVVRAENEAARAVTPAAPTPNP